MAFTVTVTDSTGATAEESFVLYIAEGPLIPRLSDETKQDLRDYADQDFSTADVLLTLAPTTIFCLPCAAAFEELAVGYTAAAELETVLVVVDPPDANFMNLPPPVFATLPTIVSGAGLSQADADAFNAVITNLEQEIGYANVIMVASNRAQGASLANNEVWQNKQIQAAQFYAIALSKAVSQDSTLRANLSKTLSDVGLNASTVTLPMITAVEMGLRASGLTATFATDLQVLGLTSGGVKFSHQFLAYPNATPTGQFSDLLLSANIAASNLANSLLQFAADRNDDKIVNCSDLKIVKASFGQTSNSTSFDPRADVNMDGVVNILDLSFVAKQLPAGTVCQ